MIQTVLVTGANGEVGHVLIPTLAKEKGYAVFALDVNDLDTSLTPFTQKFIKASVLDRTLLTDLFTKNRINAIYHLAGILSTGAEKVPEKAQEVNAGGTALLLELSNLSARKDKRTVKFFFPSTIAAYGLPDLTTKTKAGKIAENQFLTPLTMYGINKLYCEMLGHYYSTNYKMLDPKPNTLFIDFRSLRFPGLISAITVPTGGTSDYGPEMIHAAAKGEGYESFVRQDTTLPFMVMPDAIKALLQLTEAPREKLTQDVYNVTSFSLTAGDIAKIVNSAFKDSSISYVPDKNRQRIVDSWPADVDDTKAKTDWGWQPDFNVDRSFKEYLIPEIQNRYQK